MSREVLKKTEKMTKRGEKRRKRRKRREKVRMNDGWMMKEVDGGETCCMYIVPGVVPKNKNDKTRLTKAFGTISVQFSTYVEIVHQEFCFHIFLVKCLLAINQS